MNYVNLVHANTFWRFDEAAAADLPRLGYMIEINTTSVGDLRRTPNHFAGVALQAQLACEQLGVEAPVVGMLDIEGAGQVPTVGAIESQTACDRALSILSAHRRAAAALATPIEFGLYGGGHNWFADPNPVQAACRVWVPSVYRNATASLAQWAKSAEALLARCSQYAEWHHAGSRPKGYAKPLIYAALWHRWADTGDEMPEAEFEACLKALKAVRDANVIAGVLIWTGAKPGQSAGPWTGRPWWADVEARVFGG